MENVRLLLLSLVVVGFVAEKKRCQEPYLDGPCRNGYISDMGRPRRVVLGVTFITS